MRLERLTFPAAQLLAVNHRRFVLPCALLPRVLISKAAPHLCSPAVTVQAASEYTEQLLARTVSDQPVHCWRS